MEMSDGEPLTPQLGAEIGMGYGKEGLAALAQGQAAKVDAAELGNDPMDVPASSDDASSWMKRNDDARDLFHRRQWLAWPGPACRPGGPVKKETVWKRSRHSGRMKGNSPSVTRKPPAIRRTASSGVIARVDYTLRSMSASFLSNRPSPNYLPSKFNTAADMHSTPVRMLGSTTG
jgi:hypothetical protein